MSRAAAWLVALVLVGGCSGDDGPPDADARATADAFVRSLVEGGDAGTVAATASLRSNVDAWREKLASERITRVESGALRRNCVKPFPVFETAEPGDCFVYALSGPGGTARLRAWVERGETGWRVTYLDYTPNVGG